MAGVDVRRSCVRASRLAWGAVLLFSIILGVRLLGGFSFGPALDPDAILDQVEALAFPILGVIVICVLVIDRSSRRIVGRVESYRFSASTKLALPPARAREVMERGMAQLVEVGFDALPPRMTEETGWEEGAEQHQVSHVGDPLRLPHSVTFTYDGSILTISTRLRIRYTWFWNEDGERDLQAWMLGRLSRGESLKDPPPMYDLASLSLSLGLLAALSGAVHHFGPTAFRNELASAHLLSLAFAVLGILLGGLFTMRMGKWTVGKGLYIPAAALTLLGYALGSLVPVA